MQNNAGELSQKLLRSLDDNYNVIDMPTVLEVISVLEKISLSKELLQSSRLGKYVNEVRRNTTDDHLAKRTRDLVKKWRNEFIAEANGQLKPTAEAPSDPVASIRTKRQAKDGKSLVEQPGAKRPRLNGNNELDLSDNSNSSFKDVLSSAAAGSGRSSAELIRKDNVIVVNSDSNSSVSDIVVKQEPPLEQQLPKKRGRKKGSKNHKSLLDEAETSFSNKMAVSRGNAKVKTTQELIAGLQNRNNVALGLPGRVKEDLNEKAAKLTERVSIIDQKLYNTNANNFRRKKKVLESGTVTNVKEEPQSVVRKEEEVIVVEEEVKTEEPKAETIEKFEFPQALSVEDALKLLPPVDRTFLEDLEPPEDSCTCLFDEDTSSYVENSSCPARSALNEKYDLNNTAEEKVKRFLSDDVPNLNGNYSLGLGLGPPELTDDGLYKNVVPNRNAEKIPKWTLTDATANSNNNNNNGSDTDPSDDIKRYRISEGAFREWNEVVEAESYGGEVVRILPYVIID